VGCFATYTTSVVVNPNPISSFSTNIACQTYPTSFTNLSSTDVISWTWQYGELGNGTTTVSPEYIYTNSSTYIATLTVLNSYTCTNISTQSVLVNATPIASFTNTTMCLGQVTTFTNVSSGATTSWTWNFNDGVAGTSDLQNPTYALIDLTALDNGVRTYTVEFIAFAGAGCSDTIKQNVSVNPIPSTSFTFNSVCTKEDGQFNSVPFGLEIAADSYVWEFGDGNTNTIPNDPDPIHSYTTGASYIVTLTSGYALTGCSNTFVSSITIHPRTTPLFSYTAPCLTEATQFTDLTTYTIGNPVTTWAWIFGDASAKDNNQNPTHIYGSPSTYTVKLITQNAFGCADSIELSTVNVRPLPTASFTSTTECLGFGTVFSDHSVSTGSVVSWTYDFDDPTSTDPSQLVPNPTHTFTADATYATTLTVQNDVGCFATYTTSVVVNPNPISSFSILPACNTYASIFNDLSTSATTWTWDFGDAIGTELLPSPLYTYTLPGTYTTSLKVYNMFGCSNVSTQTAIVLEQPIADFNFDVLCAGDIVTFTDVTSGTNLTSWTWTFGDATGTNMLQNPIHMYDAGGNYPVELIVENSFGCKDTLVKSLQAFTVPNPDFSATTACKGSQSSFTDLSIDVVPITTWSWNFDDGNNSNSQNPNYIYSNHGVYAVELTVTNINGCDTSVVNIVTVNESTIASYTTDIVCVGTPTSFTDVSTGSPTTWTWSFGDGNFGVGGPTISHTYATAGTYFTSLIATNNGGCFDDTFRAVVVKNAIIPGIALQADACLNENVLFTDNSIYSPGDMAQSTWDFGDGNNVPNTLNPTHAYTSVATFIVTHTVTSVGGCSASATESITIHNLPVADFNYLGSCQTQITSFTDASSIVSDVITSWTWDFVNGNFSNNQNPTQTYALQNTYPVELTVTTDFGCEHTVIKNVVINPNTIPAFTVNPACLNQASLFTDATTGSPTSWTWDFGDISPVDNNQNPSHTYTAPTTFTVKLVTENGFGCKDSTASIATVNPLPIASFSSLPVCDNSPTVFTNLSTTATSYTWDFADGSATNITSPLYTFASDGTYLATLTAFNSFGCNTSYAENVIVHPNPVSSFNATTACQSYASNFTDISTGSVTSWTWNFGDGSGSSLSQNTSYIYPLASNYSASLIVHNGFGCSAVSSKTITVLEQPQADFEYTLPCDDQAVIFFDLSNGSSITSWTYDFGDGTALSNLQYPSHIYTAIGSYTVQFVASNTLGCKDTIQQSLIVHSVPNPAFTASTACRGVVTDFTDLSTDVVPLVDWFWDYGDGNNSVSVNPDYIYANHGVYTVALTATNMHGCSNTTTNLVTVNQAVVASYTANQVCIGLPTTFSDISVGAPTSWAWNYGDGNSGVGGPVHTYAYTIPGQYISSVIATNSAGCSDDAFVVVTVRDDITPGINAQADACLNENVIILDNSTYVVGTNYASGSWNFGDGSPVVTTLNTSHTYSAVGTYVITHTVVSDFGCVSTTSQNIEVHHLPVVDFNFTVACQNQATVFTDYSTIASDVITSWTWDFANGYNSSLQNPSTVYTSGNTYPVLLTATSDFGCQNNITKNVLVHSKPNAQFTSDIQCWGAATNFTNTSSSIDGAIVSHLWNFNDESSSSVIQPSYTFTTLKDSFDVQLNVQSIYGCLDSVKQKVYSYPLPKFKYGPVSQSGCDDYTAVFKDSSTVKDGTIVNWFWNFGDENFSYQQNPVHTYKTPGEYDVSMRLTTSYGCVLADTLNYPLIVFESPVAGFMANPNQLTESLPQIDIIDQSSGVRYWEYNFGDFETSILAEPTHTYADTGMYTIKQMVYNQLGCMDSTFRTITVNGIVTVFIPNAFTPGGNNLNDVFLVKGKGIISLEMAIFNRWGDLVFTSNDMNFGWDGKINGSGEQAKQDVYVYKVKITDALNNSYLYSGNVTLIR
jgi:gliding motility-associated-like protein